MRRWNNLERDRRDERLGWLTTERLRPTIRRRGFRVATRLRPLDLGYLNWTLFLVFFILAARVLLPWYMVTGRFASNAGLEFSIESLQEFDAEAGATYQEAIRQLEASGTMAR